MENDETKEDSVETSQEAAPPPPPQWPLSWIWLDEAQAKTESGTGTASPTDDALLVKIRDGLDFSVPWQDIASLDEGDHSLTLLLHDSTALVLHRTGRTHDELLGIVRDSFDKVIRKEALAEESMLAEFDGFATPISGEAGRDCRVQVYETALCMTFASGDVVRLPFVFARFDKGDYRFDVTLPGGSGWTLGRFGRQTVRFSDTLDAALSGIRARALEFVSELCPSLPLLQARKMAGSFLDGRAVGQTEILSSAPELWKALERRLDEAGLGTPWNTLSAMSGGARIGMKRNLLSGGATYIFFFMPTVISGKGRIVLEASADSSGSRATYVFDADAFGTKDIEEAMDVLNYGLYMINFRREPVYLTGAQLEKPAYLRYKRALQRIPELAVMRRAFLGRALHNKDWEEKLQRLLASDAPN